MAGIVRALTRATNRLLFGQRCSRRQVAARLKFSALQWQTRVGRSWPAPTAGASWQEPPRQSPEVSIFRSPLLPSPSTVRIGRCLSLLICRLLLVKEPGTPHRALIGGVGASTAVARTESWRNCAMSIEPRPDARLRGSKTHGLLNQSVIQQGISACKAPLATLVVL